MSFGYPVSLEVEGRRAVVIGSVAVADRKADVLISAMAEVTVVARGPERDLERLARAGARVIQRDYQPGDLGGAFLCVASSEDEAIREAIFEESRIESVLMNMMDDPVHCDFAAPAIVRRGDLTIAISTGGASPALARRLREELEEQFGPEWVDIADLIAAVRRETLPLLPDLRDRARKWERALDLRELERLVAEGRIDEARQTLRARVLEGENV
ncbi:MAG TPA: bifunctional precorrin-2 dehydrogenase/sirohydrochlorin ferrochelatase [Actinomycetota bacterium]|nr:bifunctional precorrin-2 dehydrogenase/sirohydrochlorin ferrochelatase [Actinomycetota bacterium]